MQLDIYDNKFIVLASALVPGVIPCIVGIVEVRSEMKLAEKMRTLVPVILALCILVVFLAPIPSSQVLSRSMTVLSFIVGISGAVVRYSRKSSSILMAVTGLILALFWILFSQPRV